MNMNPFIGANDLRSQKIGLLAQILHLEGSHEITLKFMNSKSIIATYNNIFDMK